MASEFDIIEQYFSFSSVAGGTSNDVNNNSNAVVLGIGDDAAVLSTASHSELVVATDTLVADVHFPASMAAEHVASRSLLVNVSDFSAMGVQPQWYTLALTLPDNNENWLRAFSSSLKQWSQHLGIALVGGDTTRGPLTISLTLMGCTNGDCMRRDAAEPGQQLWVTGSLGRGGAALQCVLNNSFALDQPAVRQALLQHFYAPTPLLVFATELATLASAAIDISDGLLADAAHIARRSGQRLEIDWQHLPIDTNARAVSCADDLAQWVLSHGDEYQLLFTADSKNEQAIQQLAAICNVSVTCIGRVLDSNENKRREDGGGESNDCVRLLNAPTGDYCHTAGGYDHFGRTQP